MAMKKLSALIKMSNRSNFESKALFITYVLTVVIVLGVGSVICATAILKPMTENPATTPEELGFTFQAIILCMMTLAVGICYSVMLSVPMTKDKANGNIESMLAANANIGDIWVAKTISLFLISLCTGLIATLAAALILKLISIPSTVALTLNGWFLVTIFVGIPLLYLAECFLITLIALCYSAEGGNVIGAIFCPAIVILTINLVARKTIDPTTPVLFIIYLALAAVMMVLAFILFRKVDKEKVVLSCKAEGSTTGKKRPGKPANAKG